MSLPLEGTGITGIYDTSNICQLTVLYLKNFFIYVWLYWVFVAVWAFL